MKRILFFILLSLVIMSCSPPRSLEYQTYHNFTIHSLGFDQSIISLDLEYYNPNNFGMQLKNTDLTIFINGNLLGHSTSDSLIRIPKKSSFILPVKFDVDMKNAFKNAWNTLTGREVTVLLTGKIKAGKGNVFLVVPVKYETKEKFSLF